MAWTRSRGRSPLDETEVLTRLLSHPSPSGREADAVREFVRIARLLGYRARADRAGNGVATRGRGRPEIMFLGHIDTVEGDRPVRVVRGRVEGRGAVDAKGPLASALVAGARHAGPGAIRIVAAVREETDSAGAVHLLRGRAPDAVIVGEPSGWDGVTIGYKGDLRLEAVFRQPRSHWGAPVPTAADTAIAWVAAARQAFSPHVGETPFRSLSLKVVGLFASPDADPEEARLLLDLRLPPGVSTSDALALLPRGADGPAVRQLVRIEPAEVPRGNAAARALARAVRAEGGEPTLYRKSGTSDLNVVVPVWKVPAAAYGPGDSRLDHTDREAISVQELRRGAAVLTRAFDELARAPELTLRRPGAGP